ncbi:MAG: hypothetical protein HDR74_05235 [Bacteroides sp.]|nr:hypothetical protein [Bacteroides sp.]
MINLRIYIDINDLSISENQITDLVETWSFLNTPPFTLLHINKVDAGFGTKEWCIRAPLPNWISKKNRSYWQNVGEEIFNSFKLPLKVNIILDREPVFSKISPDYDALYSIHLQVTKVRDTPPFDFSGDDLSNDHRFW